MDTPFSPFDRPVHKAHIIFELLQIGGWRHARKQLDILYRLIAPEVCTGSRDIPNRAQMGTGSGFSFHGNGYACNGLEKRAFIAAILVRAPGTLFYRYQCPDYGGHTHYGGKHFGNVFFFCQYHGRITKSAGRVAACDHACPVRDIDDPLPQHLHIPYAQHRLRKNELFDITHHQCIIGDLLAAGRFDGQQVTTCPGAPLKQLHHGFQPF